MPNTDPDKYRAYLAKYMNGRYYEKKAKAIEYLGGQCAFCSTTENLQFDHINPEDKEYAIGKIICHKWEKVRKELDKCQLLCKDCHDVKSKQDLHDAVWRNGWSNQHGSGPMR